jgi:hypothetical protein
MGRNSPKNQAERSVARMGGCEIHQLSRYRRQEQALGHSPLPTQLSLHELPCKLMILWQESVLLLKPPSRRLTDSFSPFLSYLLFAVPKHSTDRVNKDAHDFIGLWDDRRSLEKRTKQLSTCLLMMMMMMIYVVLPFENKSQHTSQSAYYKNIFLHFFFRLYQELTLGFWNEHLLKWIFCAASPARVARRA